MVDLNDLILLEKESFPDPDSCTVVFEAEEHGIQHRILKDNDKLYYRKAEGSTVSCFQVAVDWIPKDGEIHYAYTPDNKHFCTIETTLASARELVWDEEDLTKNHICFTIREMDLNAVSIGDSCSYMYRTITVVDENHLRLNNVVVRIIPSAEFTYKVNKKSISAIGGARGLYAFLENVSAENRYFGKRFPLWSCVWDILFERFNAEPE